MDVNRNSFELWAEILKESLEGALKTHIVYKCNLNFTIVENHINYLQEHDLLRGADMGGKYHYYTTQKGRRYLEIYARLKALLGEGET